MRLIDPIELKRAISVVAMSNNHKTLEQIIDEQPTIERKTGKWINHGQYADFFPHSEYRCSECDTPYLEIEMIYNFCPNCGADMRGEE